MEQFIGCDARKRCSVFVAVGEDGGCSPAWKVSHTDGALEAFLEELPEGSEIALEACSSCYWMVAAANLVAVNQQRLGPCHVLELYQRLKKRKNHQKAVVAVGRHLAEAAYWILKKREVYREPKTPRLAVSSTHG